MEKISDLGNPGAKDRMVNNDLPVFFKGAERATSDANRSVAYLLEDIKKMDTELRGRTMTRASGSANKMMFRMIKATRRISDGLKRNQKRATDRLMKMRSEAMNSADRVIMMGDDMKNDQNHLRGVLSELRDESRSSFTNEY